MYTERNTLIMSEYALLFPGQGSQYVGMGKSFYAKYPLVRAIFDEASDVLGFSLPKLCFEENVAELTKTANTQPAILVTSVALFQVFIQEVNTWPRYAAGHSLGEISALTCAGVITLQDAVRIVHTRGLLMQEAIPEGEGSMFVINGVDRETVEECLPNDERHNDVVIANFNAPTQFVLSGYRDITTQIASKLQERGARSIQLKVSAPFHSPLMQTASDKFRTELKKYTYNRPQFPVIANLTARPYDETTDIVDSLARQMVKPVLWQNIMEFLYQNKVSAFVEIGPKSVLKSLAVKNIPDAIAFSYDNRRDATSLVSMFIDSSESHTIQRRTVLYNIVQRCLVEAVCTKNNNWDEDEYQEGVIFPCRRIQEILQLLDKEEIATCEQYVEEALHLLKLIMSTKKVPLVEQDERIKSLSLPIN